MGKNEEMLFLKESFEKFSNKLSVNGINDLNIKEYIYALISLPFKDNDRDNYEKLISQIFKLAYDTNGDINQFFCGNILILYGLPLLDKNIYVNIKKFIDGLNTFDTKIKGIIGEDNGYCGVFGFEKRKEVTVISEVLIREVNNLINMSENIIQVRETLKNKIS